MVSSGSEGEAAEPNTPWLIEIGEAAGALKPVADYIEEQETDVMAKPFRFAGRVHRR